MPCGPIASYHPEMGGRAKRSKQQPPSLAQHLRRRRWRHGSTAAVVIAGLVVLAVVDHSGWLLYPGDDLARYDGQRFTVAYVVDGDTLAIKVPDRGRRTTHVRLWGIDTPELGDPDTGEPAEPGAKRAKRVAKKLAAGKRVELVLEPHRVRGQYKRLLAFMVLPDGRRLGETLLRRGLAKADGRWHHRHLKRYRLIEQQARKADRGIWGRDE